MKGIENGFASPHYARDELLDRAREKAPERNVRMPPIPELSRQHRLPAPDRSVPSR